MKHLIKLALLILALLLPAPAIAYDFEVDGIYYNINGNEATVTYKQDVDYTYSSDYRGNVTIPETVTHNGIAYQVTAIDDYAFCECNELYNVTIPNSVTSIGNYAFCDCCELYSVDIPNSVTIIGDGAFFDCRGLESIDIPDSVTIIGWGAFYRCSCLTSVTIGISVTDISENVFYDCSNLTSVSIGKSVTSIAAHAFYDCTNITDLIWNAQNCTSLGYLPTSNIERVSIGNDVEVLPPYFVNGSKITSVTIPNSVTFIGEGAFFDCSELNDVFSLITDPTIVSMDYNVFYQNPNNYSERTLHVPIGSVAAYQADTKWSEFFGAIVEMGEVNNISFADANVKALCVQNWDTNGDGELSEAEAAIVRSLGEVFKNNSSITSFNELQYFTGLSRINDCAFSMCIGLTNVTLPNSVIEIGDYAFADCSELNEVSFGNSVITIRESAFSDCSSLTCVTIPNSVTSIGEYAFLGCYNLTSIDIPSSITSIGEMAFVGCQELTRVNITDIASWCQISFSPGANPLEFAQHLFLNGEEITDLVIPNTVTEIKDWAFANGIALKGVTIPNSVTSIGEGAFYSCTGLTDIDIPNSVTTIGSGAFINCDGLTNVSIPNSVISIGGHSFGNCHRLTSVTIPTSVISIHEYAFNNSDNLATVILTGEGEWLAGELPSTVKTLYIDEGITAVQGMKAKPVDVYSFALTPPTCNNESFTDYSGTLHVPARSLASYFTADYWCNFGNIVGDANKPTGITISQDSIEAIIGDEIQLNATVAPTNAASNIITWTSSNPDVATVVNGTVTAVDAGECDIIVMCYDQKAVCHVVVYSDCITLDKNVAEVLPNHIIILTPSSTLDELHTFAVTSSDPTVAAARVVNGKVQVVGIKEGTVTITVGSADGTALPASCVVTVYTELGDTNCDGYVDINDVTDLISYVLGNEVPGFNVANADLIDDGMVDINDVTRLINVILNGW